jgi:hypothetical protein
MVGIVVGCRLVLCIFIILLDRIRETDFCVNWVNNFWASDFLQLNFILLKFFEKVFKEMSFFKPIYEMLESC